MKTTEQKLQVTHKNKTFGAKQDGKIEFQADVPEAETFSEAISWAGGEDSVIKILNWTALAKAKGRIRAEANNDDNVTQTQEAFLGVCEKIINEAKPEAGRSGMSAKSKAENYDSFKERLASARAEAVESGEELDGALILEIATSLGL